MALDMTKMLPPGSHSWCSEPDCGWTNLSQRCHFHGRTHSNLRGHLVHVYEAPPPPGWDGGLTCGDLAMLSFGPVECELPAAHEGHHAARGGASQW